MLALLACSRFLYIHFYQNIHDPKDALGEALDPMNQFAMLAFFLFGAATVILLLFAAIGYLAYRYDLKHPLPDSEFPSSKR